MQAYLTVKKKSLPIMKEIKNQPKGVFYNSQKGLCSIYSSGIMCYDILKKSTTFDLDYSEQQGGNIDYNSDFIIVNYHPAVCSWINQNILNKYKGKTFCIVTEIGSF